jgi:tripartite-type tricarboxylate transporter receptor subunit TctC
MNRLRAFIAAAASAAILATGLAAGNVPVAADADRAWPQRTVKVIIPLPAGTSIDTSARLFAEQLTARWGQPVVIENMPGADGIIAVKEFVRRGDNHTLLYSFAGLITINPVLHEKLPYDPARDLVPIATTSDNFLVISASGKLQVGSLGDLVAFARSHPNKLSWAAPPGLPYLAFAGLVKSAGVDMAYVPYRDFNPAVIDLGEGRIHAAASGLVQLLPQIQAGKVRVLAVMNRVRAPAAPHVPTAAEAGYADLSFDGVTGFFGWRDMPGELRDRIAADVRAVAENPTIKDRLTAIGIVARGSTSSEYAALIEEQRAKVAAIAQLIGLKAPNSK